MLIDKKIIKNNITALTVDKLKENNIIGNIFITDDMVNIVHEAMLERFNTEALFIIDNLVAELKDKSAPCPVCGNTTTEWVSDYDYAKIALGITGDVNVEDKYLADLLDSAAAADGGVWLCSTDKDGCGSNSGWKPNKLQKKWNTEDPS